MRILFRLLVALTICLLANPNLGFGQEDSSQGNDLPEVIHLTSEPKHWPYITCIVQFDLDDTCDATISIYNINEVIVDSIFIDDGIPGHYRVELFIPEVAGSPYSVNIIGNESKLIKSFSFSAGDTTKIFIDSLNMMVNQDVALKILDRNDKTRHNIKIKARDDEYFMALRILNLPSGIYRYKATICDSTYWEKFVIMR
jgi:hypothetical protein